MDLETLKHIAHNFSQELTDASTGQKTSFAFIKNTIPSSPLVVNGQKLQSMVAGGTIFRTCIVEKSDNQLHLQGITDLQQPPFDTKEHFFEFLLSQLKPDIEVVALNFAFPMTPIFENGKLDGILQYATKEHVFAGLIGEKVGASFEAYVKEQTGREIKVSVANDTICLLVSGLTKVDAKKLAAGIVGTGLNFAIFLDSNTPINLEAGGFNKFPLSSTLQKVDDQSTKKGEYLFEKAVAGGYLYQHLNLQLQSLGISHTPLPATIHLSEIAQDPSSPFHEKAKEILLSSAKLIACAVAGLLDYYQSDMTFVMQGSLFWKGFMYLQTVESTVKELSHFHAEFIDLPDSDLLGAAKLVA